MERARTSPAPDAEPQWPKAASYDDEGGATKPTHHHAGGMDALGTQDDHLAPFYDQMVEVAHELAGQFTPLGLHFRPEILLATAMQEAANKDPLTHRSFDNGLGLMQITPHRGKLDAGVAQAIGWDNAQSVEYNLQHSRWRDAKANLRAGAQTMLGKARAIQGGVPQVWAQMKEAQRWRAVLFGYNAGEGAAISALRAGGPSAAMISSFIYQGKPVSHDYTAEIQAKLDHVDRRDPFAGRTTPFDGAASLPGQQRLANAEVVRGGPGSTHAAPAPRVAERTRLNAVVKVVAYNAHGGVIRSWGAKARWEGPLPQHFHGDHSAGRWRWDDTASARSVRIHMRADGTGGELVEAWAARLEAARVEIFAEPIEAVTERSEARSDAARAPGHAEDAQDAGSTERAHLAGHGQSTTGTAGAPLAAVRQAEAEVESAVSGTGAPSDHRLGGAIAFEHALGIDLTEDEEAGDGDGSTAPHGAHGSGGAGREGGTRAGRTGVDTSVTGRGPGGDAARAGGGDEGSTSTRDGHGSKTGDQDGKRHGSEHGRYAGEGHAGDHGVRGAGALFGGAIAVPEVLQGAVELALLIEAGDITGAGADLFKAGARKAISVAAARRLVAREARIVAEREMHVVAQQLVGKKVFTSLAKTEQERALRIVYWEKQRQFFRGYLQAAKAEQRAVRQALEKARPAERAVLEARRAAAEAGEEIAKVEPVAGQLPRNHAHAGHEFPSSQLPPQYRRQGLRFKETGYPDFEPYAKALPNGQKKVRIAYTGSRRADFATANKAAGYRRTPDGWTWHHDEADLGIMYLVPDDLHVTIKHSGGVAEYKHRHGVDYDD